MDHGNWTCFVSVMEKKTLALTHKKDILYLLPIESSQAGYQKYQKVSLDRYGSDTDIDTIMPCHDARTEEICRN